MKQPALDDVLVVNRQLMTRSEIPEIAEIATTIGDVDRPQHLTRYPGLTRRLRDVGVDATSVPALARNIVELAGKTLIPSAVDQQLRISALQGRDLQEAPECIAEAARADRDAIDDLGSRILGMAAWQDIDLSERETPISEFASVQESHTQLLNALGWTPPERMIPEARRALEDDIQRREFALGSFTGLVVWETEELIRMDRRFLRTLKDGLPTVGVVSPDASLRRPYAETTPLLTDLEERGANIINYTEVTLGELQTTQIAQPDGGVS